jgi:multidrug efflux system membrane fusion protein
MRKSIPLALALGIAAGTLGGCGRQGADAQAGGGRRGGGAAVPVVAGVVGQRDTPIYLDGIGTVQAFSTVTIHSQVNGVLQKVAFKEGQDVKAGDRLAVVDPRPYQAQLDQAAARKAEDEAQLFNATVTYERNATLLKQGLVDRQTVDTEKAAMDQMKAQVQADSAAVEQQAVMLGYCSIRSPISGRTGMRLVDEGNLVQASDPTGLVVVTQIRPVNILFTLPQQDWPRIQRLVASGEKLSVIAMGDSGEPAGQGTLSVVDNQIDTTTGTIKLKAVFANENLGLWPGQFVNVRLLVETRKGGTVVPAGVIQRGPQGAFAFVIRPDSTVEARPVEVAQIDADTALIDKGLVPGERVVVDGQYKLQAGSRVAAQAAPAPTR